MTTMVVGLPGDYLAAYARPVGLGLVAIVVGIVAANALPWEWGLTATLGAALLFLGGGLTVAAIRAGVGARRRWQVLFAVVIGPTLAAVPVAVGLLGEEWAWALVPLGFLYGVAWTVLGIRLFVVGSGTIVDPPGPGAARPEFEMETTA
jgi:hypothetical protein